MRSFFRQTRVRLTAAVATVFVLVAAAAAVAFWLTFAHIEYGALDASLSSQAQSLLSGLEDAHGHVTFNGHETLRGETPDGIGVAAILLDHQGRPLDQSGAAPSAEAVASLASAASRTRSPVTDTITDGGHSVRALAQPVDLGAGSVGALVVTRPTRELHDTLLTLGLLLASTVVVLATVVSLLAYHLAGRALRPVRVIAATARDLSQHDLHRRLSLDLPPDELGELAETFNAMLARLDSAFTALRQFTADAAHELRAPLALLRAELEVSLRQARSPAEYRASQQIALAEVERLSGIADQLLTLARADAGALRPAFKIVDLGDLAEETVERWRPLARPRGVELSIDVHEEGSAKADPELLRRLLDNLLDNAVRHTPTAGAVLVTVTSRDDAWEIVVSDTGPGIPAQQRASIFERFTRGDAARGRATGGAGLGLALCRVIAEVHGGRIVLDGKGSSGATFRLYLPRDRPQTGTKT